MLSAKSVLGGRVALTILMQKLGDIRWGSLIPRDQKSFPQRGQHLAEMTMVTAQNCLLHGQESTTLITRNKPVNGKLLPLKGVGYHYFCGPDSQFTDCLTL